MHIGSWYPWKPEEGIRSFGSAVTGGCELPCGSWESNWSPLKKQPVLLIAKQSLQPQVFLEAKVTDLLNIQSWTSQ